MTIGNHHDIADERLLCEDNEARPQRGRLMTLPLGRNRTWGTRAKGVTYERGRGVFFFPRMVSDGYVPAMGIPQVD